MSSRRDFLKVGAAATLSAVSYSRAADAPAEKVRLAVMGVRGRGRQLIQGFTQLDDVEFINLIDPDANVIPNAVKAISSKQKTEPKTEKDVRKALEDKSLDGLIIAAPDHWHALAAIWACQAGKHVYVEKPISHNLVEGRRMVEAARKYNRVVQVGTQRRSAEYIHSAAEYVRSGKLGKVPFVRTLIAGNRKSIGKKEDGPVPAGVDFDLWTGPAPLKPFNPNRFHYEWHWQWETGTGELGNNGIHALDVARIVVPGLDHPTRVSSGGGKLFYDDDRVTPDTQIATFDFPNTCMIWEHRIWSKTGFEGEQFGVALYGEKGTLIFNNKGWKVVDPNNGGAETSQPSTASDGPHYRNFLDCVKSGKKPNADIEEGHLSTRLCHLGNIAYRTGRTLNFDAKTETILNDPEASKLLNRDYRKGFEVPEKV